MIFYNFYFSIFFYNLPIYLFLGPYFEIFSEISGQQRRKLYRSEVARDSPAPSWKPFTLNVSDVGGLDVLFLVQCKNWNENGYKNFIGEFRTTLREWTFGKYSEAFKQSKNDKSYGAFVVESLTSLPSYVPPPAVAVAYEIKFASKNLDGKDMALLGKSSGNFKFLAGNYFY